MENKKRLVDEAGEKTRNKQTERRVFCRVRNMRLRKWYIREREEAQDAFSKLLNEGR